MTNETSANNHTDLSLNRFVSAQNNVYQTVLEELNNGNKQTHWMWFIFPQIDGLGTSTTARFYAIKSIDEAKAYLTHPFLGKRLLECSAILLTINDKSANDILGFPDYVKLQSCMTLFSIVFPHENIFEEVLIKYYKGQTDEKTIVILESFITNNNINF